MPDTDTLDPSPDHHDSLPRHKTKVFAGFWRRFFALILDSIVLGILGSVLGFFFFFDLFAQLGPWGRLVGFCIALLYFGLLNSHIGRGQTIGKRLMRIRVVHLDSSLLSLAMSLLRYSVIGVPIFLNGISIPVSRVPTAVTSLIGFVVFGLGGTVVYLFLFNRPSRRSLHDFIAASVVVKGDAPKFRRPPLWRGHLAFLATLFLLVVALSSVPGVIVNQQMMTDLRQVLGSIESTPNIRSATVFSGSLRGPQGSRRFFTVTALLRNRAVSAEETSEDIASVVLQEYPEVREMGTLRVILSYGYDIGIARSCRTSIAALRPQEWINRVTTGEQ